MRVLQKLLKKHREFQDRLRYKEDESDMNELDDGHYLKNKSIQRGKMTDVEI